MKEKLLILCLLSFFATVLVAQQPHIIVPDSTLITSEKDSLDIIMEQAKREQGMGGNITPISTDSTEQHTRYNIWKIHERTGERYDATADTLLYNYQHTTIPDGHSIAMGHLGDRKSVV